MTDALRHKIRLAKAVNRVDRAIDWSKYGESQLNYEVLSLPGMSSPKVRSFLNNLKPVRYMEVGVHKGSTFISACFGNVMEFAMAYDDFSLFNESNTVEQEFRQNVSRLIPTHTVVLRSDCSFFDVPQHELPQNVDVYFYDGDHTYQAQRQAITHAWPALSAEAIIVIDDANMSCVMEGTKAGLDDVGAVVHQEWQLPARFNGDLEQYWHGLYVAVINKQRTA